MKRNLSFCAALLAFFTVCGCTQQKQDTSAPVQSTGTPQGTAAPDAPSGEEITLTMAVCDGLSEDVQQAVEDFNAADNGCRIELKDYSAYMQFNEDGSIDGLTAYDPAALRMQMDILQGGVVDIVPDRAFIGNLGRYEILMQKGAFIDLYPFMESDPEINTQTLDAHILSLHETDGELRCLPLFYTISTLLGNPDYVGTKENWTFAEMQAHWEAAPDGLTFNHADATKNYVYYTVLREELGAFIDYGNATCSFDSPLFTDMLRFCDSFPETPEYKTDTWDVNDFVYERTIRGYQNMHIEAVGQTLVGYPSEDGCGGSISSAYDRYAVCRSASPEQQQAAWQFLRTLASETWQYDNMAWRYEDEDYVEEVGFPVNLAAGQRYAGELIAKNESGTPNGKTAQGTEFDEGWLSQAEYDRLTDYVAGIGKLDTALDRSLQDIVEEEIWRMFDGIQTPEGAASAIQGRAQLLVSERS